MKFRHLISLIGIVVLFTSCHKGERRPNIIFILADDLGYSQLGCYGQEKIETPNIDALAAKGMLFTQNYSGAPLCSPSRCVLLTGQHPGHSQIRANDEQEERGNVWDYTETQKNPYLEGQFPLKAGTLTIAKLLQNAGYKTAAVGKWGLGGPETDGRPNKQGFDFFFGHNCQRQAWNYYPRYLWKDSLKVWLNNSLIVPGTKKNPATLPEGADPYDEQNYSGFTSKQYAPELMQKEALNFIRENARHPFFLYYATPIPHTALQAPQRLVRYYHQKFGDEKPYSGEKGYFPARYPHATFAAMVSYLDEQVGELIAELKKLGLYENTLFFFSSDNGPADMGGADSPWFDSAKPFKCGPGWGKGNLSEGGIRVPMIAQWPGKIAVGSQTDYITAFYDILPTLCDVAGIQIPQNTDGISFLPVLLGQQDLIKPGQKYLYWEFPTGGGQQAIRQGKWKARRMQIFKDSLRVNLYNLEDDIQESEDVSSDHPEVVREMETLLKKEHQEAGNKNFRFSQLGDH